MYDSLATENFVEYSKYHEECESLGSYAIESQAGKLLSGLGFGINQLQQKVKELSGGWQIRLNLAQALLQESDILLLESTVDEYMLVGEGQVKPFDGDMKDYYKYIPEVKKTENEIINLSSQPITTDTKKQARKL